MKKTLLLTFGALCGSAFTLSAPISSNELTVNGGFELGNTSSWVSFPSPSSTFSVTNQANSGSFAGELVNSAQASSAVIKQANLGVGLVNPGDVISISFAAKGSSAAGGVAFAEFFSELSGGGVSSSEILGGAPLNLTGTYQTFNFSAVAGSDVSGGVTLQFAAVTGANVGSVSELCVDDVSVSINGTAGGNYCVAGVNMDGEQCTISFNGSASLAANDLVLVATDVSSFSQFGLFLMGDTQAQVPLGQGFLCLGLGGQFFRMNPILSYSNQNVVTRAVNNTVYPANNIAMGETWNFQFFYRDSGTSNLSDGVAICFVP